LKPVAVSLKVPQLSPGSRQAISLVTPMQGGQGKRVICCEQKAMLEQESVAFQVRTMIICPGTGELVTVLTMVMTTLVPSQRSEPLGGSKVIMPPQSTVLLGAQMRDGGRVS
jgi:hypothetical protein